MLRGPPNTRIPAKAPLRCIRNSSEHSPSAQHRQTTQGGSINWPKPSSAPYSSVLNKYLKDFSRVMYCTAAAINCFVNQTQALPCLHPVDPRSRLYLHCTGGKNPTDYRWFYNAGGVKNGRGIFLIISTDG